MQWLSTRMFRFKVSDTPHGNSACGNTSPSFGISKSVVTSIAPVNVEIRCLYSLAIAPFKESQ